MQLETTNRLFQALLITVIMVGCAAETPDVAAASVPAPATPHSGVVAPSTTCSDATPPSMADVMGRYVVQSVERYRGGFTTPDEARKRIGEEVMVTGGQFRVDGKETSGPRYAIECHDVSHVEGEVPTTRQRLLSTFYGHGTDRKVVWELSVEDAGTGDYLAAFEVLPGADAVQLWRLYDGWLYVLQPAEDAGP